MITRKFFKQFNRNFIFSTLLYFTSIVVVSVAFCYNDQNIKASLYTEFECLPKNSQQACLFSKIGAENFITDKIKLKFEYGKLLDVDIKDYIFESKKKLLNFSVDSYSTNYFMQTAINFLYHDPQNEINAIAKLGTEFNIIANIYVQPKISVTVEGTSKKINGSPNKQQIHASKLITGSEIAIGTNFYIKNTNIRLNPEIVASYNADIITNKGCNSNISANIVCDIDNLICKVGYSYSSTSQETLAVKFGVKI